MYIGLLLKLMYECDLVLQTGLCSYMCTQNLNQNLMTFCDDIRLQILHSKESTYIASYYVLLDNGM